MVLLALYPGSSSALHTPTCVLTFDSRYCQVTGTWEFSSRVIMSGTLGRHTHRECYSTTNTLCLLTHFLPGEKNMSSDCVICEHSVISLNSAKVQGARQLCAYICIIA